MILLGRELERVTAVTPFGFRLWDPVERRSVADELEVTYAWDGGRARPVSCGPSGVFRLAHVPGSAEFERGAGDEAFWADPPDIPGSGVVRVRDRAGRFMPFRFAVDGAVRIGAAFREACRLVATGSPPEPAMPHLPLFSTAGRPRPSGMAMATAQLVTLDGTPARGALLEIRPPGQPRALGLANEDGMVVVFFPYPEPETVLLSPPGPTHSLWAQSWEVGLSVFYRPTAAADDQPDLCALLDQTNDPAAGAIESVGSPDAFTLTRATLGYGRPLVLRTLDRSELLIDPV